MNQRTHMRERGTDTPVCKKLPTFYSRPVLTNQRNKVTCKRCVVVMNARMWRVVEGLQ